jgi:hypothetical protein
MPWRAGDTKVANRPRTRRRHDPDQQIGYVLGLEAARLLVADVRNVLTRPSVVTHTTQQQRHLVFDAIEAKIAAAIETAKRSGVEPPHPG